MTDSVKILLKFDRLHFPIRKVMMTIFLQSLGSRVAKATTKPFVVPNSDEDTWIDIIVNKFKTNAKAYYALLQALNNDDISRVISCKSDYKIWSNLVVTHEGTSHVKEIRLTYCVLNIRTLV